MSELEYSESLLKFGARIPMEYTFEDPGSSYRKSSSRSGILGKPKRPFPKAITLRALHCSVYGRG
jgi:hypothetical protein